MVREVILDMSNINFKGNTLDVGINNYGIIYNILKQTESEISVDYYVENFNGEYRNQYDNGVLFFSLSQLHKNEVEDVIKNIWSNVRFGGNLYIWDREKQKKETVNDKVKVLMTGNKEKEFEFIDNSISNEFTIDSSKKILEKYFEIEETKVCDKIIFIKGIKRGSIKNENTANSNKLKVHSQQSSSEVPEGIYKGFRFPR
ncbi:hypothetical protein H8J79_01715 [Clostridium perfringens]|uniref:hypothetical protein n=1 Tax=Clostridium perfringens TaxID=1502 RepID=UPI0018E4996E|nr:hypothetical protein [Clostridium perfringens]MBI6019547.1 hypothetical protein [Clostridium perfringens]